MKRLPLFLLAVGALFLAACAGAAQELPTPPATTAVPQALPQPQATNTVSPTFPPPTEPPATVTAVPTQTPLPLATAPPPPAPASVEPRVTSGQTAEGVFFRGDPDAPVTILDYSDFL